MHRTTLRILTLSLAGTLLCGTAFAQSSSAPASSQAPASTSTTPKAQKPSTSTAAGTTKSGTTAAKKPATPFALKTEKEKQSYALGLNLGRSMKRDDLQIDPEVLARGLKDGFSDKKALITDEEVQAALTQLKADAQKHQQEQQNLKQKQDVDHTKAADKPPKSQPHDEKHK